ncbi:MAG TPA: hypothetical protein VKT74_01655, partial [Gammaproteobacteria bacterium]|nr:hypothetical protein [Gammaproteobacteria bacterium]
QALQTSFAFTLSGTFDCTNHGITGLSFDKTSGSVARGASQTVTATFKVGSQAAGSYTGGVCVSGNASDNPLIVLPVNATVTSGSGGGGGGSSGGGGLGLLGLSVLVLLLGRRRLK